MPRIQFLHTYDHIISLENLLEAWKEFVRGKRSRKDVQEFERNLMTNIISLRRDLATKTYAHSAYQHFKIADPKPRNIHKANVRDRLLHHAICRVLYPFFDRTFISDSFSCRLEKGTHKAVNRFRIFGFKVSKNNTRTCWVLKCDARKFFANIDHRILLGVLERYIPDKNIIRLLTEVIGSFHSTAQDKGLPLGNLTSQLFVNIYMNELDQFMKHKLKAEYYIRYADDFVIFSRDRLWLQELIPKIETFLFENLKLRLHPDKVYIKTAASGVDFLGWVNFPDHKVLRTATKRRMMKRVEKNRKKEMINSYLGLLKHGNTYKLRKEILLQ